MPGLLVNFDVDDLQRGVDFYCKALGLRIGRRFGIDGIELPGASLERPVRTSVWGKLALLADPFGHGFGLVEFVDGGCDEITSA